jgi:hypothetical protein
MTLRPTEGLLFGVRHSIVLSYALVLHFAVHPPIVVGAALGLWVGRLGCGPMHGDLTAQD